MSLGHSPSVVTNGLVLYTDMSNTQKSWKGAPTTNLLTYSQDFNNSIWTTSAPPSTITSNYAIAPDGTNTATRLLYQDGVNCRVFQTITSTVGQTYTFSVWIKSNTGSSQVVQLYLRQAGFGTTYANVNPTATTEWQRFSISLTIPVGATDIMTLVYKSGASGSWDIQMWGAQYELSSFATPYIPTTTATGSRSNTQAIVDLTGNNTITATSLTYASDNTFSFNGSSNLVISPENSIMNTNTPTVEVWVKTAALSQSGFWFEKGQVNTSYALFQEGANIVWRTVNSGSPPYDNLLATTASYLSTSAWAHIVGTYTSGAKRLYINGVQVASNAATGTIATNANGCSIGAYGGFNGAHSYYYNGSIGNVKVYNRALSATEVAQNFNALRGRYSL